MRTVIEQLVETALAAAVEAGELELASVPEAAVERPRDAAHGDWATTVALRLAKELGRKPREIAEVIARYIERDERIAAVEVAGPGFVNLRLSPAALQQVAREVHEQGADFARVGLGADRRVNVEFISANPTGPMHVGHGRWAALGDALANILEHAGWQVTREFYINDAGVQMEVFGRSVLLRYRELCGEQISIPEAFYGGSYVSDIAQRILSEEGEVWLSASAASGRSDEHDERACLEHFRERGYALMLEQMQSLCNQIGVHFDVWFSERSLYEPDNQGTSAIERTLARLRTDGYLYEQDGATWFRSTDFGDDKDRVLIKADGSYTYFAPDIAYHLDKFERGHDRLIDIWGADHHGYIPRMQAACTALGHEGGLAVLLGQLVNLFRAGEVVRMSKRTGEMVTFAELVEEVGADATKYLMLSRSSDQPIDFDIEVASKQDASNPVYYVQYAHARICSILRKARGEDACGTASVIPSEAATGRAVEGPRQAAGDHDGGSTDISSQGSSVTTPDLSLLVEPAELDLLREIARLSEVIELAARDLAPYRLTHYAEALAANFTAFYHACQVIGPNKARTAARLYLCDATRKVLALTLGLLGVSAPERM